eukprot:TRINITY_DN8739_c0_g1_i1.p1 TRINITY_DN8739_c0_g1~~TRINITY_DN8739_c0_g1_i1.p1  ORF type:complete len:622 (-),score=131.51 TRINITY_DN8739_c0_g1_i1:134-1999(-)
MCIRDRYPLDVYNFIALQAFKHTLRDSRARHLVYHEITTFFSVLIHCLANEDEIKTELFEPPHTLEILKEKWSEQVPKILERLKGKSLQQINLASAGQSRSIYVLIPLGLPGMGKTKFAQYLKKACEAQGCVLAVVSSDEIRIEAMNKIASSSKRNMSEEELYAKTINEVKESYQQQLKELLGSSQVGTRFILLDRNQLPNTLEKTFKEIREFAQPSADVKVIALAPISNTPYQTEEGSYPFSAEFFFETLIRILKGKDDDTLQGNALTIAATHLRFFQSHKNFVIPERKAVDSSGFDLVFRVPFTEEESGKVDLEMRESLREILRNTTETKSPEDDDVKRLLDLIKKLPEFTPTSPEKLEKAAQTLIGDVVGPLQKATVVEEEKEESKEEAQVVSRKDKGKKKESKGEQEEKKNEIQFPKEKQRLPTYLGIGVVGDRTKEIFEYVRNGLEALGETYHEEKAIQKNLQDFAKGTSFERPRTFHITTLFIGGAQKKVQTQFYTRFIENLDIDIRIHALVYVPDCIITGVCVQDQSIIPIENEFPHMTLLVGKFKPKDSNTVLSSLFGQDGPLHKQYKKGFLHSEEEYMDCYPIKVVDGKVHDVYIYKPKEVFQLEGKTKTFN